MGQTVGGVATHIRILHKFLVESQELLEVHVA